MVQSKKKFYAVKKGHKPGIYKTWFGENGAEIQIKGVKGARFKGFQTLKEAQTWLNEEVESVSGNAANDSDAPPSPSVKENDITIYTDGGALNNPGPGGYGAVMLYKGHRREISGGFRLTTNNRMELTACIAALSQLKRASSVTLYTDSKYVVNGITKGWAKSWKSRNWKKSNGDKALNPDLWAKLLDLCDLHDVHFVWVKGHAGNPENERCDQLAKAEAAKGNQPKDRGYPG